MPVVAAAAAVAAAKYASDKNKAKSARLASAKQSEGVKNAQEASSQNFQSALEAIKSGLANAQGALSGDGGAESVFTPSYQQGESASQLQADYSGINGSEAQRAAYQNFQSSPGQQWLQQRAENAILRAQGRLGGGLGNQASIMQKLQENAQGMAQQDFGNQYNRLSEITNRGQQSASAIASIRGALASMLNNQGANLAQLFAGQGSEQAQLAQNLGVTRSGRDIYDAQAGPALHNIPGNFLSAYSGLGGGLNNLFSGSK